MTALALVETLATAGVVLAVESDRLVCDGPDDVLTDAVLAELAARKFEILVALGGRDAESADLTPSARPVPWDELSTPRWGPAADDPEPGIAIPRGHVRRPTDPEAEQAAQDDPYAVIERACVRGETLGGGYDQAAWVSWARGLAAAEWDAWRACARAIEAGLPGAGTIAAIEESMRLAWREMVVPAPVEAPP